MNYFTWELNYLLLFNDFSSDKLMSPFKYYLSRSDKQAKARHSSTAHNGLESSLIEFVGVDTADGKEAMDAYVNACKKKKRSTG